MDIHATRENSSQPFALSLTGAPAGASVEVRMTNTMNGTATVFVGEAKNGSVAIPAPRDFGQHTAFDVRVLTAATANTVIPFSYTDASTPDHLVLASTVEAAPVGGAAPVRSFVPTSET